MNKYEIDASIKEKADKLNEFILTNNKSATKRNTTTLHL